MYKVQKFNKIADVGLDIFDKDKFAVSDEVQNPDAVIVRSFKLNDMEIKDKLKAIGRAGAGVNNIPIEKCNNKGVVVFNTPGANANAVKEMVLTGMLLSSRDVVGGIAFAKSLIGKGSEVGPLVEKNKSNFKGWEINNKKLGVIGLGAIGVMVANDANSLGMKVLGYDPFLSVHSAWGLSNDVKPAGNLDTMLLETDIISIHVPLTDNTKGFMNKERFSKIKQGTVLINFSRADIVNEKDLIEALNAGTISCYVTDFPTESLLKHEKVICIPHLGASTSEAEDNCAVMVVEQIQDFLLNGNIKNSVNFPDCFIERSGKYRVVAVNKNVPNIVGQITSVLAKENLNIADMVNKSRGELACTIVDLNEKPSDQLISEIEDINGILNIRLID
ncbi:MAG: phosphoglycerate dehydrogenase [bacterium]|nr:phosphoglycerate dehydrogenase [bacterium]